MTRVGGRVFRGPPLPDLFSLGRLGITPSISFLLDDVTLRKVIEMHAAGQWCDPMDLLSQDDQECNERVLADRQDGGPRGEVLSRYRVMSRTGKPVEVCVITIFSGAGTYTVQCLPEER